jgi:hypothetical protein
LRGIVPLKVETLHADRTSRDASGDRTAGVKMVIRPPQGVSASRLAHILRCHSTRTLFGEVDASQWPDDPFWLPGTWVHFEVRSDAGNYALTLEAESARDNLKLAARAKSFANARVAGRDPGATETQGKATGADTAMR